MSVFANPFHLFYYKAKVFPIWDCIAAWITTAAGDQALTLSVARLEASLGLTRVVVKHPVKPHLARTPLHHQPLHTSKVWANTSWGDCVFGNPNYAINDRLTAAVLYNHLNHTGIQTV